MHGNPIVRPLICRHEDRQGHYLPPYAFHVMKNDFNRNKYVEIIATQAARSLKSDLTP